MAPILNPRIKVCCISSVEEAQLAVSLGASALGLVSRMPSGPGPIPESLIAEALAVAPYVDAVLLDSGNPTLKVKELGAPGAATIGPLAAPSANNWACHFFWRAV